MEELQHKYVTVAYDLYTDNAEGIHELVERAPKEHPFQFITGMGVALESFENRVASLAQGETFDFTLSVDEAYGPYVDEHVIELDRELFCVDGRFDKDNIYPGNVIPLVNADGNRFQGLIIQVGDDKVTVDLNHPLAGKALHFKGEVVTSREATDDEVQGLINRMSGGDCCCDGEGGCCGGHGEDGGCCGHGEGHHGHDGGCCGHGEGHHSHEGGCCGHGEGHKSGCCGHTHNH